VINLAYDDNGTGEPVLFIAGRGGLGRTWHLHQVPAFLDAGYRVITFDNRGVGATASADGFTTESMVADTAALIESIGVGPVRIVSVSMGSYIAQELMLTRPRDRSSLIRMASGLEFLVFDELHTYRGRQGADVAMLIRRVKDACTAPRVQCIGTSATMSSKGTAAISARRAALSGGMPS